MHIKLVRNILDGKSVDVIVPDEADKRRGLVEGYALVRVEEDVGGAFLRTVGGHKGFAAVQSKLRGKLDLIEAVVVVLVF